MTHKTTHDFRNKSTGEAFTVDLDIDVNALARRLAIRALASKVGVARTANGSIVCRIVKTAK